MQTVTEQRGELQASLPPLPVGSLEAGTLHTNDSYFLAQLYKMLQY